jgi:hypothetical protein
MRKRPTVPTVSRRAMMFDTTSLAATCLTPEVAGMVSWLNELDRDAAALTAKAKSGVIRIGKGLESVAGKQLLSELDIAQIKDEIRILRSAHLGLDGEMTIAANRISCHNVDWSMRRYSLD